MTSQNQHIPYSQEQWATRETGKERATMQELNFPFRSPMRHNTRITGNGLKVFIAGSIVEDIQLAKSWEAADFLLSIAIHDSAIQLMVRVENITFSVEIMRSASAGDTGAWLSANHSNITIILADNDGNSLIETDVPLASDILFILRYCLTLQCTKSLEKVRDSFSRLCKTMP